MEDNASTLNPAVRVVSKETFQTAHGNPRFCKVLVAGSPQEQARILEAFDRRNASDARFRRFAASLRKLAFWR